MNPWTGRERTLRRPVRSRAAPRDRGRRPGGVRGGPGGSGRPRDALRAVGRRPGRAVAPRARRPLARADRPDDPARAWSAGPATPTCGSASRRRSRPSWPRRRTSWCSPAAPPPTAPSWRSARAGRGCSTPGTCSGPRRPASRPASSRQSTARSSCGSGAATGPGSSPPRCSRPPADQVRLASASAAFGEGMHQYQRNLYLGRLHDLGVELVPHVEPVALQRRRGASAATSSPTGP